MPGAGLWSEEKGSDSRQFTTPATLVFDTRKNSYVINKLCKQGYKYETSIHGVGLNELGKQTPVSDKGQHGVSFGTFQGYDLKVTGPLPDQGQYLRGEYAITDGPSNAGKGSELAALKKSMLKMTGMKVTGNVSWSLAPAGATEPEAWVEYEEGGSDWLPEDDNTVTVKLTWQENLQPTAVRFVLYDVSAEPGINLNSQDTNTEPDLSFAEFNRGFGYQIKRDRVITAEKKIAGGTEETIAIQSKDFGAYGKLKAEIEAGGAWLVATARPIEQPYLPVPYDDNKNFIADKWEKDVGIYERNLPPSWDEDPKPDGQRRDGDGFTLYEEYRGFEEIGHVFRNPAREQVKGSHVRMDPLHKDIFIYDRDLLFTRHYKKYNPADLNWHLIDLFKMKTAGTLETNPDYRWVNFNTSKKHFARNQYAIFIANKGVSSSKKYKDDTGYTPALPYCSSEMRSSHPLQCIYRVEIYLDTIKKWAGKASAEADRKRYESEQTTTTVIHEVGHALGIKHHKPHEDEGVKECAIRYDSATELGHPRLFGFLRTAYCKDGGVYLTGKADDSGNFQQFSSHNCYGQINVKGD